MSKKAKGQTATKTGDKPRRTICPVCSDEIYTCCFGAGCSRCDYTICACNMDRYR